MGKGFAASGRSPLAVFKSLRTPEIVGEFRQFLLRGNLVELAVAVVVGTAFNAVVQSLVKDLITPLIGAAGGDSDFSQLSFTINGSEFNYGSFINALLSFVIVAAVVFFLVVKPLGAFMARFRSEPAVAHVTRECPECLSEIPVKAKRCSFCTVEVGSAAAPQA
jgi:large conductance mechanosensitive channel